MKIVDPSNLLSHRDSGFKVRVVKHLLVIDCRVECLLDLWGYLEV